MRGRRIQLTLPKTGSMYRRRNTYCFRIVLGICFLFFLIFNLNIFTTQDVEDSSMSDVTNDSTAAILSMVPSVFHKFLTSRTRNQTLTVTTQNGSIPDSYHPPNISEILKFISKYNDLQIVLNEDVFGPLQNDSVIIVIQVHSRITYLRHLIVSLAQARDISRSLLIFSHDFYDEDLNDLIQSIDFCKVMQIFYPYSIQTHPYEFPGVDPGDCPRDIKKDQAIVRKCNNALHPDLYGHYREAQFTQTKHHWWWKANRVFDQLEITRYHTGLVLFLEEDHYVAEDFLYLLELMQRRALELCPQCNVLSLGTYLKTFNYYTYNSRTNRKAYLGQTQLFSSSSNPAILGHEQKITNTNENHNHNIRGISYNYLNNEKLSVSSTVHSKNKLIKKENYKNNSNNNINNINSLYYSNTNQKFKTLSQSYSSSPSSSPSIWDKSSNSKLNSNKYKNIKKKTTTDRSQAQQTWSYHVLPSLYSIYQKVEVMPWISSKHNMGFAFNKSTWREIRECANYFCSYDDYNWDWSLQHLSQNCLKHKLHAMIVKGPRVFHIGECGVHHKKKNCDSNQVIAKVQSVLKIARSSKQMFPKTVTLTVASILKKTKLRKGNGGWGDKRDHILCINMTLPTW